MALNFAYKLTTGLKRWLTIRNTLVKHCKDSMCNIKFEEKIKNVLLLWSKLPLYLVKFIEFLQLPQELYKNILRI